MQPQNSNDIISAITQLGKTLQTSIPQVSLPSLNLNLPNAGDLDSKYQEFLTRASNDPDIVNYYNQLLQQAQGDTQIAQGFLENDYQTGVRNTVANLTGTLKQMGIQNTNEQETMQDTLNKRGIALTEQPNQSGQPLSYATQGQAGYERGKLNETQSLRQEAENRSAQQTIGNYSNTLKKGITSTGQQLVQTAQDLAKQKQGDIASRAGTYYGIYQSGEQAKAQKALMDQQNAMSGGGGGGKSLGAKPSSQPDPRSPGIGVNTTQNGWRWTGSDWAN